VRTLCLVGGTMGAGKTIICKILADDLSDSVFLDGDRCGDLHPLRVTDETKRMGDAQAGHHRRADAV